MKLSDLFFPWNLCCNICRSEQVNAQSGLCEDCLKALPYAKDFCCLHCGREIEIDGLCSDCMSTPPHFDKALSPFLYNGNIKKLIQSLKYKNKQYLATPLAFLMAEYFPKEILLQCTKITPVPLHKGRLHTRGYNQSFLLAKELSKLLHLPCENGLLERTRQTEAQAKMTREQRLKNVKNAFVATKALKDDVILLIDDVLTTGATVDACARALKKGGAEKVFVLSVATGSKKH